MKRTLYISVVAMICALGLAGCTDVGPEPAARRNVAADNTVNDKDRDRSPLSTTVDSSCAENAGRIHNHGLSYIRGAYDYTRVFATPDDRAAYMLALIADYFQGAPGWDRAANTTAQMRDSLASVLGTTYATPGAGMWQVMRTGPACVSNVSPAELAIIDRAMNAFTAAPSGTPASAWIDAITLAADSGIAAWRGTSWPRNGGELSGGFLHIMKGSAEYWRTHAPLTFENPNPWPVGQIIQADCAGYLVGWLMAVVEELDANGRLDVRNQGRRMNRGFTLAIGWSFGGLLRTR